MSSLFVEALKVACLSLGEAAFFCALGGAAMGKGHFDAETLRPVGLDGVAARSMSWPVLCNLNRLSSTVAKELVVCNVLVPPGLSERERSTPRVLERLSVHQMMMKRWLPEKTRSLSTK